MWVDCRRLTAAAAAAAGEPRLAITLSKQHSGSHQPCTQKGCRQICPAALLWSDHAAEILVSHLVPAGKEEQGLHGVGAESALRVQSCQVGAMAFGQGSMQRLSKGLLAHLVPAGKEEQGLQGVRAESALCIQRRQVCAMAGSSLV